MKRWNDIEGRGRSGSGFTVIEVLIALFLVTFTVLVLGGFTLRFLTSTTHSTNRSLARAFAVEQLEALSHLPYSDLTTTPPSPIPDAEQFTRSVTVRRIGGASATQDYKIVTVEVQSPGITAVRLTTAISAP